MNTNLNLDHIEHIYSLASKFHEAMFAIILEGLVKDFLYNKMFRFFKLLFENITRPPV